MRRGLQRRARRSDIVDHQPAKSARGLRRKERIQNILTTLIGIEQRLCRGLSASREHTHRAWKLELRGQRTHQESRLIIAPHSKAYWSERHRNQRIHGMRLEHRQRGRRHALREWLRELRVVSVFEAMNRRRQGASKRKRATRIHRLKQRFASLAERLGARHGRIARGASGWGQEIEKSTNNFREGHEPFSGPLSQRCVTRSR